MSAPAVAPIRYTRATAAQAVGKSVKTIDRAIQEGLLRADRCGRRTKKYPEGRSVWIRPEDLDDWIEAQSTDY